MKTQMDTICTVCKAKNSNYYSLFKFSVITTKNSYELSLLSISREISDWAMKKMYLLSATQILLFRPDIICEFLVGWVGEDEILEGWFLNPYCICHDCFKIYEKEVPLK